MHKRTATRRCAALATALAATVLLGGCGSGVHLEGPGFEALGLTNNKSKKDAKVPDRAPLLVPPDRARLPEPVPPSQQTAAVPKENWPTDPDVTAKQQASEEEKQRRKYEDEGDWSKKADIDEFDKLMDPMERRRGVLSDGRSLGDRYRDNKEYR